MYNILQVCSQLPCNFYGVLLGLVTIIDLLFLDIYMYIAKMATSNSLHLVKWESFRVTQSWKFKNLLFPMMSTIC